MRPSVSLTKRINLVLFQTQRSLNRPMFFFFTFALPSQCRGSVSENTTGKFGQGTPTLELALIKLSWQVLAVEQLE